MRHQLSEQGDFLIAEGPARSGRRTLTKDIR